METHYDTLTSRRHCHWQVRSIGKVCSGKLLSRPTLLSIYWTKLTLRSKTVRNLDLFVLLRRLLSIWSWCQSSGWTRSFARSIWIRTWPPPSRCRSLIDLFWFIPHILRALATCVEAMKCMLFKLLIIEEITGAYKYIHSHNYYRFHIIEKWIFTITCESLLAWTWWLFSESVRTDEQSFL